MKFKDALLINSINEYLKTGDIKSVTIDESFVTVVGDNDIDNLRVLVDPSPEAVIHLLIDTGPQNHLGGIKLGDEFCFWDRDESTHNNIASRLGYGNKFVGFYLYPRFTKKILTSADVVVTDFSGVGIYNMDGATEELINSKLLLTVNKLIDISSNIDNDSDNDDDISNLLRSLSPSDY